MRSKAKDSPSGRGYIPALTGFRALAAGMVFVNHYYSHWHQSTPTTGLQHLVAISGGRMGVTMFFALSGYLIPQVYFRRFAERSIGFGQYWVRRFARIYPAFFFLLTLKFILAWMYPSLGWGWIMDKPDFVQSTLVDYSLLQAMFPDFIWSGISPAWSLTVEESFYLLAPLLFVAMASVCYTGKAKGRAMSLARLSLCLLGASAALWLLGETLFQAGFARLLNNHEYVFRFGLFGKFPIFAVGIAVALMPLTGHSFKIRPWMPETATLAGIALIGTAMRTLMLRDVGPTELGYGVQLDLEAALGAALLIGSAVQGGKIIGWVLGNRVAEYLGRISFILYLLQENFFAFILIGFVGRHFGDTLINNYLVFSTLAALLYEAVESPAHRLILRLSAPKTKPRTIAFSARKGPRRAA